mgnify:CR=1 FL=1
MIKSGRLILDISNSYLHRKSLQYCLSKAQSNSKIISDDILQLGSPLLIVTLQPRNPSTLFSSLQTDVDQGILSLSLKPSLKIDKKVKKNDKDDDRDIDRTAAKLKVKKKTRSKISFDEDYDSVNELFEKIEIPQDASLLPLARPDKPLGSGAVPVSFTIKQKNQVNATPKKKKTTLSSQKKNSETAIVEKPTKIILTQPKTV